VIGANGRVADGGYQIRLSRSETFRVNGEALSAALAPNTVLNFQALSGDSVATTVDLALLAGEVDGVHARRESANVE
jgi:hypothetical protein